MDSEQELALVGIGGTLLGSVMGPWVACRVRMTAEEHRAFDRTILEAWPDHRWVIEDVVAEGDRVVLRNGTSTHSAEFFGLLPVGSPLSFSATSIFRIARGHIIEAWRNADDLGRVRRLGGKIS